MGVFPRKKGRFFAYICYLMNPNRSTSNLQGAVYQYTYNAKKASGVCLQNTTDYSPFGVTLDGRTMQRDGYRYGFNAMQKDDEVKGSSNSYTTEFRQYDPRTCRWQTIDPKMNNKESPYVGFGNNPMIYKDPLGDTVIFFLDKDGAGGKGHMGMAYQNEKGTWFYFSFSAVNTDNGLLADNDGEVEYAVIGKLTAKAVETKVLAKGYSFTYDKSVILNTTSAEDKLISSAAEKFKNKQNSTTSNDYNAISNNCADACIDITNKGLGNAETKREKLGPYYSLKPNSLWPDIVKEVKEINNKGNVPYFYDSYIPTDNDTKIKYDNLNPNYYNNLIPVVGPIKKIKYKQDE